MSTIASIDPRRGVHKAGVRLRRYVILLHRWMGVFFAVLFLMWFLSGIVLMYCDYPAVSAEERLQHLLPLDAATIHISPEMAAEKAGLSHPTQVALSSILSRPVYQFRGRQHVVVVYADSGEIFRGFTESEAREVAAAWVHQPASSAGLEMYQTTEDDQWTVQQKYHPLRPIWKFSWPTGEVTYVSDATGEIVQYTTRASRLGAYFGAIPHWIYITRLRRDAAAWSRVVIWLSGAGTIMTFFGMIAGIWMYSPSKRYRFKGSPSSVPYDGQMRWHMFLGLIFGFVTFTWILSGMLSMTPFHWPANPIEAQVRRGLVGALWSGDDFQQLSPSAALQKLTDHLHPKEMELTYIGGQPVYIATESTTRTAIVSLDGGVHVSLDKDAARELIARASAPYPISESRIVTQYEAYYVDRDGRKRLPVLYVRLADPQQTIFYLDLHNGRIVQSYDRMARWNRWLYRGLHEFDLPWLYRNRPVWDLVVLVLMIGGTWLSVTGLILGWRRLIRTLR